MDNVVPLWPEPKPEPKLYWVCAGCGCISWYAHADSSLECSSCHAISVDHGGAWRAGLPEPTREEPTLEPGVHFAVVDMNLTGAAKARHLRKAAEEDVVLMARIEREGECGLWSEGWETEEQRDWMLERLERIKQRFLEQKVISG